MLARCGWLLVLLLGVLCGGVCGRPLAALSQAQHSFLSAFPRLYASAAEHARRAEVLHANLRVAQSDSQSAARAHSVRAQPSHAALQPRPLRARVASSHSSHTPTRFDNRGPAVFGMTRFADLTPQEFRQAFHSADPQRSLGAQRASPAQRTASRSAVAPASRLRFMQAPPPTKAPPPKPSATVIEGMSSQYSSSFHTDNNPLGQPIYTRDEDNALRAQALVVPQVPYTSYLGLVDKPVDWSGVTPLIQNIGACGACWAAVSADLLQAAMFRARGQTWPQVSYQWMVDCNRDAAIAAATTRLNSGNGLSRSGNGAAVLAAINGAGGGCSGGSISAAIDFMMKSAGYGVHVPGYAYLEQDYHTFRPTDKSIAFLQPPCRDGTQVDGGKRQSVVAGWSWALYPAGQMTQNLQQQMSHTITGHADKALGAPNSPTAAVDREVLLAQALSHFGPLAVMIDSSRMQMYKGGVMDKSQCSSEPANGGHQALLVGLASGPSGQYWVVKNNWGEEWGEKGYLFLKRGGNTCGIANQVVYANIVGDVNDPFSWST